MKKTLLVVLSLTSLSLYAQGVSSPFRDYQRTLATSPSGSASGAPLAPAAPVAMTSEETVGVCTENVQTSLPLSTLLTYVLDDEPELKVDHDNRTGKLRVFSSANIVGNCASMIDMQMDKRNVNGKFTYVVDVKFKPCPAGQAVCKFPVVKVENDQHVETVEMDYPASLVGYKKCLEDSGVVKDNRVVPGSILRTPLTKTFNGATESGDILFASHGPSSATERAQYGDFKAINGCDHYETINTIDTRLTSAAEEDAAALQARVERLRNCTPSNYGEGFDFVSENPDNNSIGEILNAARVALTQAATTSANAIRSGTYTANDIKVMNDFYDLVVETKIDEILEKYDELADMSGDKSEAQAEFDALQAELLALKAAPLFDMAAYQKLVSLGKFDDAETIASLIINIDAYAKLGKRDARGVIDPRRVIDWKTAERRRMSAQLDEEEDKFNARTGLTAGGPSLAQGHADTVNQLNRNIMIINNNYAATLQQIEQSCRFNQSPQCLQRQAHNRQVADAERERMLTPLVAQVAEHTRKAEEFAVLENEGRRHLASQGLEVPGGPVQPRFDIGMSAEFEQQQQQIAQQQYAQQMMAQQQQAIFQQRQQASLYPQQQQYGGGNQYNFPMPQFASQNNGFQYGGQAQYGSQFGSQFGAPQQYNQYGNQQYGNQQYGGAPYQIQPFQMPQGYGQPQAYGQPQLGAQNFNPALYSSNMSMNFGQPQGYGQQPYYFPR